MFLVCHFRTLLYLLSGANRWIYFKTTFFCYIRHLHQMAHLLPSSGFHFYTFVLIFTSSYECAKHVRSQKKVHGQNYWETAINGTFCRQYFVNVSNSWSRCYSEIVNQIVCILYRLIKMCRTYVTNIAVLQKLKLSSRIQFSFLR